MRRVAVTLVALVGLALIAALDVTAAPSGLRGLVVFDPARPVCVEGQPCTKPAAHVVIVFSRKGHVAARVKTRADGWYGVTLQPGTYRVSAPGYRVGSGVTPRSVLVPDGRTARVDLQIDPGFQ